MACECEITECQTLPDGRFYLEIRGVRRCRLTETWEQVRAVQWWCSLNEPAQQNRQPLSQWLWGERR